MIKFLVSLVFAVALNANAISYSSVKKSVYKIVFFKKTGLRVPVSTGTAFVVKNGKEGVFVTNNHLCESLAKMTGFVIIPENGEVKSEQDLDKITEAYMYKGADICLFKTAKQYKALPMAKKPAAMYEKIAITGFDGEASMMPSEGYIYGRSVSNYFSEMKDCKTQPPRPFSIGFVMCLDHDKYPDYSRVEQQKSTAKISPGYSGSPVLNMDGEVVGIANAYDPPTPRDLKSYSYIFTVDQIRKVLSSAKFVPSDDKSIAETVELLKAFEEIIDDSQ